MAKATYSGREADLKTFATSSGSSAAASIGGLRDWAVNVNRNIISVVHKDSSGWTDNFPGYATWTMTAGSAFLSSAATQEQDALRGALAGETRLYYLLINSTGTGAVTFKGFGYVTSWDAGAGEEDPQLINFEITGDGALSTG